MKIITILLLFTSIISAEINATYNECLKTYGKPHKEISSGDYKDTKWKTKELWILCTFHKEKVIMFSATKLNGKITKEEVWTLVNKQLGKIDWKEDKKYKGFLSKDYGLSFSTSAMCLGRRDIPEDFEKHLPKLKQMYKKEKSNQKTD